MGRVSYDVSVSLDGFTTGPNDGPELGLGEGGERLHEWLLDLRSWNEMHGRDTGEEGTASELLAETYAGTRAIVIGKRMFTHGEGPWGDDPPFRMPVFVVTHEERPPLRKGQTTFNFVNGGVERAIALAREVAGEGDVAIGGGSSVATQALAAGLLDEIQIHIVPVTLGGGVRLFEGLPEGQIELEPLRVLDAGGVTHIRYRVTGLGD
jgi:dihydrofolate reductase